MVCTAVQEVVLVAAAVQVVEVAVAVEDLAEGMAVALGLAVIRVAGFLSHGGVVVGQIYLTTHV